MSEDKRKLVGNERAKLTATYLNNLAVALAVVGAFTPIVTSVVGADGGTIPFILLVGGLCILGSGGLHLLARLVLRRLLP